MTQMATKISVFVTEDPLHIHTCTEDLTEFLTGQNGTYLNRSYWQNGTPQ
jgi:hypothetical protein